MGCFQIEQSSSLEKRYRAAFELFLSSFYFLVHYGEATASFLTAERITHTDGVSFVHFNFLHSMRT